LDDPDRGPLGDGRPALRRGDELDGPEHADGEHEHRHHRLDDREATLAAADPLPHRPQHSPTTPSPWAQLRAVTPPSTTYGAPPEALSCSIRMRMWREPCAWVKTSVLRTSTHTFRVVLAVTSWRTQVRVPERR